MQKLLLVLSLMGLVAVCATCFPASDAAAQATCRTKCTEDEQACLKRTNNKGQCGNTASQCLAKCK
jgi:hypothetical protein